MKTLIFVLSFVFPFSMSNNLTPNISIITKAIGDGDAATLGSYFDSTLELTILDKQDVLDKIKATEAVKNFFMKNKPRAYNMVHQGTSKGTASHYTIGDMQTANGTFRVYLYYKSVGSDRALIQEMRIEK